MLTLILEDENGKIIAKCKNKTEFIKEIRKALWSNEILKVRKEKIDLSKE